MTDLAEARALAEAARADTSEGLEARERLASVVDQLVDMLGAPSTQWAARCLVGGGEGMVPRDGEENAREFIAVLPDNVRHVWCVVRRTVYRYESPWEAVHE